MGASLKMARRLADRPVSTAEVQVQVKTTACPDAWVLTSPFQLAHRLYRLHCCPMNCAEYRQLQPVAKQRRPLHDSVLKYIF